MQYKSFSPCCRERRASASGVRGLTSLARALVHGINRAPLTSACDRYDGRGCGDVSLSLSLSLSLVGDRHCEGVVKGLGGFLSSPDLGGLPPPCLGVLSYLYSYDIDAETS